MRQTRSDRLLVPSSVLRQLAFALLLCLGRAQEARPYALVSRVPGHTQLQAMPEGLQLLESLSGPVAPVVVIGPYRSGKSFLLNQLLGVPCDVGFGVGHTRDTQTKGIWVWGQPPVITGADGVNRTVLLVDTEGFEAAGHASSYDDRIFALSTVLASLLIYNLAETIRESDVSKLSFAVELAQGFYSGSQGVALQPVNMVWLIQRDFLQGKSVEQVVQEALAPVPNTQGDADLAAVNAVRSSLAVVAANSTGFSLPQPHLERARLCELNDSQLDPRYLTQRQRFKELVWRLAVPKVVGAAPATGSQLAQLLRSLIAAVNAKELPTAASLVTYMNQELLSRVVALYEDSLARVDLPAEESVLLQANASAAATALELFQQQLLGRRDAAALQLRLGAALDKALRSALASNAAESGAVCQAQEMECERTVDALAASRVPSMRRFEGGYATCRAAFEEACVGPARALADERLRMAYKRARGAFSHEYNDRLFTGLLALAVLAIVVCRFLVRLRLLELLAWLALLFLEVYPRVAPAQSMYASPWWGAATSVWEALVLAVFGVPGAPLLWLSALVAVGLLAWRRRRRAARAKRVGFMGDVRDLDV